MSDQLAARQAEASTIATSSKAITQALEGAASCKTAIDFIANLEEAEAQLTDMLREVRELKRTSAQARDDFWTLAFWKGWTMKESTRVRVARIKREQAEVTLRLKEAHMIDAKRIMNRTIEDYALSKAAWRMQYELLADLRTKEESAKKAQKQ
jgi:hypothetical protein